MNQPLLVLDVSYLCHRTFHASKGLSWNGKATGVIFSFLKSISFLKDEFQTDRIAFAFEHPHLLRKDFYSAYKRKRHTKERTEEEMQSYRELSKQIQALRTDYLPRIGFKNIFCFDGYEADDILAKIAETSTVDDEVVLVTGDSDLYQCLRPGVMIYSSHKQKVLTVGWFVRHYGIGSSQWAVVKALAGCSGDEVEGIAGVGEKTAIKWMRGVLKKPSKVFKAIDSAQGRAIVRRNRVLVQLPYSGCPVLVIQEDIISKAAWVGVCSELGMRSIAGRPPIASRKLVKL